MSEHVEAEVEYVSDIDEILSYGVPSPATLVINDGIVMQGYRVPKKIEQALREACQI